MFSRSQYGDMLHDRQRVSTLNMNDTTIFLFLQVLAYKYFYCTKKIDAKKITDGLMNTLLLIIVAL